MKRYFNNQNKRLGRSNFTSKRYVVKVGGQFYCLHFSANIKVLNTVSKVGNGRMGRIVSTKDLDGFLYEIWFINILNWMS